MLLYFKDYINYLSIFVLESLTNIDSLQEWLGETRESFTHVLNDKSFEHDTQAATGSTTGDWFILLYASLIFT